MIDTVFGIKVSSPISIIRFMY